MTQANGGTEVGAGGIRAAVVGGSLGGLAAGVALYEAGCDVDIFERVPEELRGRGAGIVAQPELLSFFEERGISTREELGVPSEETRYLRRDGSVKHCEKKYQLMTSWGTLYHHLRSAYPDERYHQDSKLAAFEQDESGAVAHFEGGGEEACDLLVGADGIDSTCRSQLLPEVKPEYAGYVAWRGLVEEGEAEPYLVEAFENKFTFFMGPSTQVLCYLIPGPSGELTKGERSLNWVWYWNVAEGDELREVLTDQTGIVHDYSVSPGELREDLARRQGEVAEEVLPDVFRRLFVATDEPFIQAIYDLSVSRMAFGRACLIGDSAFVPRPHTAWGTSKAVADAVRLAECLSESCGDIAVALEEWEPDQLELGRYLEEIGKNLGDRSQFR